MNREAHIVRQLLQSTPRGSRNDRRVQRTQQALVRAFVTLVQEKGYDYFTINDLLKRADVGRSTFYTHYRGKDDLLQKSFEHMLTMLYEHMDREGPSHRIAPVRELFAHVWEFKSLHQALVRSRVMDHQHHGRVSHLSRLIERRIASRRSDIGMAPPPVLAQALAGALFALLRWWVDNDAPYAPELMDEMFHATYDANRLLR